MLQFSPTYHDQSLDPIITELLPEIEQSLKKQLLPQLQAQAQAEFEAEWARIQAQAEEEYQQGLEELNQEGARFVREQTGELRAEVERLRRDRKAKAEAHRRALEDKYIAECFQEGILGHPKVQEIEQELALQIIEQNEDKIEATKQRRMKELAIKMQAREQKHRREKDKIIKTEIYQQSHVQDLKGDIEATKIRIASMRSEYNVKIKKIDGQIKQMKARIKQITPKQNIEQLRDRLQQLKNKQEQQVEKILYEASTQQQEQENNYRISCQNDTFTHLDCSSQLQPLPAPPQYHTNPYRNPTVAEQESQPSQHSDSEDSLNQLIHEQVSRPPIYHPDTSLTQSNVQAPQSQGPILRLNIASLLRDNWEDPLQKYINPSVTAYPSCKGSYPQTTTREGRIENNQNDSRTGNRSTFQQVYHQHLEKLNQGTRRKKLSTQTKKAIIRNLCMQDSQRY